MDGKGTSVDIYILILRAKDTHRKRREREIGDLFTMNFSLLRRVLLPAVVKNKTEFFYKQEEKS